MILSFECQISLKSINFINTGTQLDNIDVIAELRKVIREDFHDRVQINSNR